MSKQTKPLNNTEVSKAKPKDKPYRLYDGGGLVLNIAKSGTKTWYYQYKHPVTKKADMFKIGRYPAVSLAEARKQRQDCEELLQDNIDPKDNKKKLNEAEQYKHANDFKSVFDEWLPTKNYSERTLEKTQTAINEIITVIGNKPVSEITVMDCMKILRPIESAGHYTKLEKTKTKISQVMSYAIATGRATENPAMHLKGVFKTAPARHNPAIIDEKRLGELVTAIHNYRGQFSTRRALKFALIMFARPGEIRHTKWKDVDFDNGLWSYTPSKTANSTAVNIVSPLPTQAISVLREMETYKQNDYVFPSIASKSGVLSENTLNQALRRMGFDSSEQTSHGFRAIARTLLEEKFKYDYRMIEMQLAHQVRDSNGRAYNRVQWLDERREMLQTWADYLESIRAN